MVPLFKADKQTKNEDLVSGESGGGGSRLGPYPTQLGYRQWGAASISSCDIQCHWTAGAAHTPFVHLCARHCCVSHHPIRSFNSTAFRSVAPVLKFDCTIVVACVSSGIVGHLVDLFSLRKDFSFCTLRILPRELHLVLLLSSACLCTIYQNDVDAVHKQQIRRPIMCLVMFCSSCPHGLVEMFFCPLSWWFWLCGTLLSGLQVVDCQSVFFVEICRSERASLDGMPWRHVQVLWGCRVAASASSSMFLVSMLS